MITTNSKIKVISGCKAINILKNQVGKVVAIEELGKDYSYAVKVTININGKVRSLYARHINRLSDDYTNLNTGRPEYKISIQRVN